MKKVVSVKELAKFLKMTDLTVYRLANAGKIPGKKFGKQWRFDLGKIEAMIDEPTSPKNKGSRRKLSRSHKKRKTKGRIS